MFTKIIALTQKYVLTIETTFYLLAFMIPFAISGPQILTGTVVNLLLYVTAAKLNQKNWWIIAALPSLGAFSHGVIFGPATFYLFYFLPFIWMSNLILMYIYKANKNFIFASAAKTVFLFATANIYFSFHIVPKLFVTTMGLLQLETALAAGVIAIAIFYERNRRTV